MLVDFPLEVGHDPVVGVTQNLSDRERKALPD
jgi:hypothetical protein